MRVSRTPAASRSRSASRRKGRGRWKRSLARSRQDAANRPRLHDFGAQRSPRRTCVYEAITPRQDGASRVRGIAPDTIVAPPSGPAKFTATRETFAPCRGFRAYGGLLGLFHSPPALLIHPPQLRALGRARVAVSCDTWKSAIRISCVRDSRRPSLPPHGPRPHGVPFRPEAPDRLSS